MECSGSPVEIQAPPSKSLSHRALAAAALADGVSFIRGLSESADVTRTREALAAAGTIFVRGADNVWEVRGTAGPPHCAGDRTVTLNAGESGTSCRLLSAVAAAGRGRFLVRGEGRMDKRPMGALLDVLENLGARCVFYGERGHTPFLLLASGLEARDGTEGARRASGAGPERPGGADTGYGATVTTVDCTETGQYLSGLLLAAPLSRTGLRLRSASRHIASLPYIGLTLEVMAAFGAEFRIEKTQAGGPPGRVEPAGLAEAVAACPNGAPDLLFVVPAGRYKAAEYRVEGDWSGASYFLAAGAVGPHAVRVAGLNPDSLQGDAAFLHLLEAMGARTAQDADGVTVFPSRLKGIQADLGDCPDLAPTLSALAAHACGATVLTNAANLKLKESDRIAAPAAELSKVGCAVKVTDDGMVIIPPEGGPRRPSGDIVFSAYNDHRMAMSLALLGLPGRGGGGFAVRLDNPGCVVKSFPKFWESWERLNTASL
ncbi:MAG: 3-phosphoshikimate 1-carboxyvinyltransferase [Desulfovibrio sp.]|jgi:3-phosphoshikimate 1-carboxyvinyltransferase|nr:3-phosphoshikimate 1-carboxyvinyltransferase [Desulfovibrio sp.]